MRLVLRRRYRPINDGRPGDQPGWRDYDLSARPCPSISAEGIAGVGRSQYDLRIEPGDSTVTDATIAADKPPYRPPTLDEIREIPWNGLNVISTFSGCGGSSTGYRMAGYRVLAAVEFVPAAQESYALNMAPYTRLVRKDVREIGGPELLEAASDATHDLGEPQLRRGDLDLFDGSPPCEPFSSAGKRDKTWNQQREYSGQRQRTDDLFLEYARLVDELHPRVFVAENVEGLVRGRAIGYFKQIHKRLEECGDHGYAVKARVLDAQWLGVPQERHRLIFVGVRRDLADRGFEPAFPDPFPYRYTVREALPHIFRIGRDVNFDRRRREGLSVPQMMTDSDRANPCVQASPPGVVTAGASGTAGMVEAEPGSGARYTFDTGGDHQAKDAGERDRSDEPAPAITATGRNATHHRIEEPRVIHDRAQGFNTSANPADVTDRPAPAIVSGGGNAGGGQSTQIGVEGDGSDRAKQLADAGQDGFDEQIVGNDRFEPVFGTPDVPSPTIMAGGARTSGEVRNSQTYERRKFTIPELKAICGFPDDYRLHGSYGIQWERLGDSVPPLMMLAISSAVRDKVLIPNRDLEQEVRANNTGR